LSLFSGLLYNFRGLMLGLRTGKLLFWGVIRFVLVLAVMCVLTSLILAYHTEIMELLWTKPESPWIVWLWYLVSWLISFLLVVIASLVSFLASQVIFSAVIMDHMSRITERLVQGYVIEPKRTAFMGLFFYLIKQEIPRAFVPLLFSLLILILGWLTPLGPALAVLSSATASVFLAWDNTDLIPARRFVPFRERWRLLVKNVFFHLGFGLPFLIPGLNIFFLSFAPVGGTLYFMERHDTQRKGPDHTKIALDRSSERTRGDESR
jgi:CysZ protein